MPKFGPISRNDFIRYMRKLGFEGPESGTKHQLMVKGNHQVRIPNPHRKDISVGLLNQLLKEALISKKDWEILK